LVTTPGGRVLRRRRDVWDADWGAGGLVASLTSSYELWLLSGRRFRTERELIERRHSSLYEPTVSPDGRLVAAVVAGPRRNFIAVFSAKTGKLVRRLTGPYDFGPEWSSDGKHIVFNRYTQPCDQVDPCAELYTVRSDGRGRPRSLGVQGLEPTWGVRRH
jgi:Tol biopolymer transport system component